MNGTSGPRRQRTARIVVLAVGVLVGLLFAGLLNDALGISFQDKDVPQLPEMDASEVREPASFEPVDAVVVPDASPWLRRAGTHVRTALEARTGTRPELVESADAERVIRTEVSPDSEHDGEHAFTVSEHGQGLSVSARDRRGLVRGYYWLADRIRTGSSQSELLGTQSEPDKDLRLVDLGGLGVPTEPWDASNYSHNTRRFSEAIGFEPPYVDESEFDRITGDYIDYVDRMRAYGNNGIVEGGFLDLVTFDRVGDGTAVYGKDSPYRARHDAISDHKDKLWQEADDAGMDVYLSHTELALTPPLKHYLRDHCGGIDAEDSCIWQVYKKAIAELFDEHPAVDGMMIRVGEAGEIYDPDSGLEYSTELAVRSDEAVRTMLRAFLEVADEYDKKIIFRSWTVGIGEVGEMHTDADVYERVLSGMDSPNLVVSTKFVDGDFYRFLPFNETLKTGEQRRIVELQDRREYEGFMAFPDLTGPMHAAALSDFESSNPHIDGVWQWNQNGGPQQAGPMSLYPFHGFWLNIDANVYTTSRMVADPDLDATEAAADWVRRRFGDDPEVVRPLVDVLDLSRKAVKNGLYISPYASKCVRALGLEPPPMMWIFEWDIVSGSNSVLSVMYHLSRNDVDAAAGEADEAVAQAERMRTLVDSVPEDEVRDPELLDQLRDSVDYEIDLLETLGAWRETFLRYYQWLDTGSGREAWHHALATFRDREAAHVERYGQDLDFPAYNFVAVDRGLAHATHNRAMTWLARGLLAVLLLAVIAGCIGWLRFRSGRAGLRAPAALVHAMVAPGRMDAFARVPARVRAAVLGGCCLWLVLAVLAFSSFQSVHFPVLLTMMTAGFAAVAALANRQSASAVLLCLAAPLVLVGAAFMAVCALRGPGLFWLRFWTSPDFRTVFATVCVTLLIWTGYACYAAARHDYGRRRSWAGGTVCAATGAMLVAVGAVPAIAGLETMVTGFNNEMGILPLGLSISLGITTHLGIPESLPWYLIIAGLAAIGAGLLNWLAVRLISGSRPARAR